jgi:DNA-binding NarL/FixJ family response regulator
MRILLVGPPQARALARARLEAAHVEIAGEFSTISAARASRLRADGILLTPEPADPIADETAIALEPLTAREHDVLHLLAEGLPNKTIAERLGISDQTVKFHVASITGKLGASNRTEAVHIAARRGLITI